jgi:cyclophilin family peptidyl-prolyl cis-trans isomerase
MFFKRSSKRSGSKKSTSLKRNNRRAFFEPLETRNLLSVTLPSIASQTVLAGAPLNIPLAVSGTSESVSYTVSVNNANLTATVPTGNSFLKLHVHSAQTSGTIDGDLIFELYDDLAPKTVANLKNLINQTPNFYENLSFHRIIKDFMIQGGDPKGDGTGGPNYKFDDEFDSQLQFTGSGILAMANSGDDTNGSQFFITTEATRWLDFNYNIFGQLVKGADILAALESVPVHKASSSSSDEKPSIPDVAVTITSATIITDNQDGVLRLSALNGTTGTAMVTVTAKDITTNETSVQQFSVTIAADTTNDPPFLNSINPIQTTVNTPVNFTIPATDVEGDSIYYNATVSPANSNITLTVNHTTGAVTLTPSSSLAPGVYSIQITAAASSTSTSYDTQLVPVYINPAAPTTITLLAASDSGSSSSDKLTNLDNTTGKTLQFQVDGVISGATVQLFSDGTTLIGSAVASGTSVTITTNGTVGLTDGTHAITAKQLLTNKTVSVGNLKTTTDLTSPASAALTITIDTAGPIFNFTPIKKASIGYAYNCPVSVSNETANSVVYKLTSWPTGMTMDPSSGLINWTPPTSQTSPVSVTIEASDKAGNSSTKTFSIDIVTANNAPVLATASPNLGAVDENHSVVYAISSFVNGGVGTTQITDADALDNVGGIALIGVTGNGTWEYSPDGINFTAFSGISESSALLLPKTASLRYTPDSKNGGSVTITYRAWDTTAGSPGLRMDVSLPVFVGGITAFSSVTDTATLTVTQVNDAPVLTPANPSLGSSDIHAAKTFNLTDIINGGSGKTAITDVDAADAAKLGGIAVIGATGVGTWAYSLDGGTTFTNFGTVSNTAALLLPKNAVVRYTPNGTTSETPALSYRAWDGSTGSNGDKSDLSASAAVGGTTPYSTQSDVATFSVYDINDPPVLTPANPLLGSTTEDDAKTIALTGTFINNGSGTTTIADADSTAVTGGIAIIGMTGNGTWAYSLDGTTFTTISTLTNATALLLPKTASLKYTPNGKSGETATIVYRAWDTTSGTAGTRVNLSDSSSYGGITAYSSATDTASLTVTNLNDAPILIAASPSMGTVAPSGVKTINLTGSFINNGTGSSTVTDADTNAVIGGIALVGITGSGTWEYSTDGTTFTSVGTISNSSALLLPKTASLRYTATGSTSDAPTITYRAWDTTTGTSGSKVDLSAASAYGGTTAYSLTTGTASITIAGGSISGYVYLDSNNDGIRSSSNLGIGSVPVRLYSLSGGTWTEVSGASPVLTAADGSYSFKNLVSGTYRVKAIEPSLYLGGKNSAGKIAGVARGTVGTDSSDRRPVIDLQLTAGESGTAYNFAEIGMKPQKISMRMSLASSPTTQQYISQSNSSPVVGLSSSAAGSSYSTTYATSSSTVAIASTSAVCKDADTEMIASMTVSIANLLDGSSETLSANVTNTALTTNYSGGVLTISGVADASVYQNVLKTITYKNSAVSPQSGNRTINVVVNDGAANSVTAVSNILVTAPPTGYSVTANDTVVNAAKAASTGFTFAGATIGTTYSYTISSNGGSGSVTGTGTITSATQAVTGINVSSLTNGALIYSVKLTNNAGYSGTAVTASATLDKTAPTGYSISISDSLINSTEASSTSFTFAGAEVGATYAYTVTTSGGSGSVTGTGTITSATQQITGINVSSLADGTLTYSVILTDTALNAGTAATATTTLNKTVTTG